MVVFVVVNGSFGGGGACGGYVFLWVFSMSLLLMGF